VPISQYDTEAVNLVTPPLALFISLLVDWTISGTFSLRESGYSDHIARFFHLVRRIIPLVVTFTLIILFADVLGEIVLPWTAPSPVSLKN
jgi:hypothetical protein